jgi:hypothetical protein
MTENKKISLIIFIFGCFIIEKYAETHQSESGGTGLVVVTGLMMCLCIVIWNSDYNRPSRNIKKRNSTIKKEHHKEIECYDGNDNRKWFGCYFCNSEMVNDGLDNLICPSCSLHDDPEDYHYGKYKIIRCHNCNTRN